VVWCLRATGEGLVASTAQEYFVPGPLRLLLGACILPEEERGRDTGGGSSSSAAPVEFEVFGWTLVIWVPEGRRSSLIIVTEGRFPI